jgi:hypothetical protein
MTCFSAAGIDVSIVAAVRSITGLYRERLTREIVTTGLHLHALQPLPHEDSGFEGADGMLATPEEHLASGDIVHPHADWYTHSVNGVEKSRDDSRPSFWRLHLAQIGCHDARIPTLQRAMRSNINVQADKS